jgi:hypothetical protein
MKTKDVLLVLGGVAVGYFAYKMNWFQKTKMKVEEVASDVKDVVVDTEKVAKCEKEWVENVGSVSRFSSAEEGEKSKSAYVKDCMSK